MGRKKGYTCPDTYNLGGLKMVTRKNANTVKMLNVATLIKPIETGMNKPTDNERSKKKIVKGINPLQ